MITYHSWYWFELQQAWATVGLPCSCGGGEMSVMFVYPSRRSESITVRSCLSLRLSTTWPHDACKSRPTCIILCPHMILPTNITQVSLWMFWTVGYFIIRVKPVFSSPKILLALERNENEGATGGQTVSKIRTPSLESTFGPWRTIRRSDPRRFFIARL